MWEEQNYIWRGSTYDNWPRLIGRDSRTGHHNAGIPEYSHHWDTGIPRSDMLKHDQLFYKLCM